MGTEVLDASSHDIELPLRRRHLIRFRRDVLPEESSIFYLLLAAHVIEPRRQSNLG